MQKHPDAIILFRVGDNYEIFNEDAVITADILWLSITRLEVEDTTVSTLSFKFHALDTYLPKLVRAGRRVAICEQL